jgi:hypothetical protein
LSHTARSPQLRTLESHGLILIKIAAPADAADKRAQIQRANRAVDDALEIRRLAGKLGKPEQQALAKVLPAELAAA